MDALEALADPTRRRMVELLAERERTVGELVDEFEISQPGVSKHLRVLRDAGLVSVRGEAQRRVYQLDPLPLNDLGNWLNDLWSQRLDALETELRRGRRTRKETR
jgi:DNA-binding transcriptional ArsR family regulator